MAFLAENFNAKSINKSNISSRILPQPKKMNVSGCSSLVKAFACVDTIADYCAINAAGIDREGAFPIQEFKRIAEAGLLAIPLMPD